MIKKEHIKNTFRMALILLVQWGAISTSYGQVANNRVALPEVTQKTAGYFDLGCNLMYAIGAVVGLMGAVKVYLKWNHGDHDTMKVASAWFGSCIFMVILATILKAFFGVA